MVPSTYQLYDVHILQVLHKSGHNAIGSDALHLISSSELSIPSTSELQVTLHPHLYREDASLVIEHSTMTASCGDLRDLIPSQRVDHMGDVRVDLPLVRGLSLESLAPRIHLSCHRESQHVVLTASDLADGDIFEGSDLGGLADVARPLSLAQLAVVVCSPGEHLVVGGQSSGGLHACRDVDHPLTMQSRHFLRLAGASVLHTHTARLVVAPGEHTTVLCQSQRVDVTTGDLDEPDAIQTLDALGDSRLLHTTRQQTGKNALVTQTTETATAPRPDGTIVGYGSHVPVANRTVNHRVPIEGILHFARKHLVGTVFRISLAKLVAIALAKSPEMASLGNDSSS